MKYSNIVYRCPGPHQRPGGTYAFRGVESQEEEDQLLGQGWFRTMPEAIDGKSSLKELPSDDAPPTREELEQKAKKLGVRFDKKTTDEALLKKVTEALGA